ncbi:hypothetical protein Hdeb2414_s0628g00926661 [Helianthus debilis subsp. tardiflorus]
MQQHLKRGGEANLTLGGIDLNSSGRSHTLPRTLWTNHNFLQLGDSLRTLFFPNRLVGYIYDTER